MGRLANFSSTSPATNGIEEDVRSNFRGLGEITMDNAQVSSHVTMVQYTERRDALLGRIDANKEADPLQRGPFWEEELNDAFARIVTGERVIERIHDAIQERMRRRRQEIEEMEMEDEESDEEEESEAEQSDDEEEYDASDSEDSEGSDDGSQEDSEDVYNDHLEDSDAAIDFEDPEDVHNNQLENSDDNDFDDPEDVYNDAVRSNDDNLLDFDASDSEEIYNYSAGRRRGVEAGDSDASDSDDLDVHNDSDVSNNDVLEIYGFRWPRRFLTMNDLEDSEATDSEEDVNNDSEDDDSDFEMVGYEQCSEFQYIHYEEDIEDYEMVEYDEDEQFAGFQEDYEMIGYNQYEQYEQLEHFEVPEFEYEQLDHEQFEIVHYRRNMMRILMRTRKLMLLIDVCLAFVFKSIFRLELNYTFPLKYVLGDSILGGFHIGAGVNFL
ncbi:unnamed protein product [Caenorhabditis nigoni]